MSDTASVLRGGNEFGSEKSAFGDSSAIAQMLLHHIQTTANATTLCDGLPAALMSVAPTTAPNGVSGRFDELLWSAALQHQQQNLFAAAAAAAAASTAPSTTTSTPITTIPSDSRPSSSRSPAPSFTAPIMFSADEKKETVLEDLSGNMCSVCNDEASGKHYGALTCFGCKGFFRRTVRANKVYTCRYEERCLIDKDQRNACRHCRFRRCLQVGMEPDAIRPDRDKTGRQKNPRRSGNSRSSTGGLQADAELDDLEPPAPRRPSRAPIHSPALGDGQCASSASSLSGSAEFSLRSHSESMHNAAQSAQRELIIGTLRQIERICTEFTDDERMDVESPKPQLVDIVSRTALIAARTPLDYSARHPLREISAYAAALRRLVVMAVDYANTLKPIADLDPMEKLTIIRSFISSFIILSTVHKSVESGCADRILLPNGLHIDAQTPLDAFREKSSLNESSAVQQQQWMESRIQFTRSSILNKLNPTVEKLQLTTDEFLCLKAIIALDPNVPQISPHTAEKLTLARDSVQQSLYSLLTESAATDVDAVQRFGHLLTLIASVTRTGAYFANVVQMSRELQPDVDSLLFELFTV